MFPEIVVIRITLVQQSLPGGVAVGTQLPPTLLGDILSGIFGRRRKRAADVLTEEEAKDSFLKMVSVSASHARI